MCYLKEISFVLKLYIPFCTRIIVKLIKTINTIIIFISVINQLYAQNVCFKINLFHAV